MKLTYQSKETVEYLRQIKQHDDIKSGVGGVMLPSSLNDAELDEYVKARSGEVKIYKLSEVLG